VLERVWGGGAVGDAAAFEAGGEEGEGVEGVEGVGDGGG
jgi:hypothetical protein